MAEVQQVLDTFANTEGSDGILELSNLSLSKIPNSLLDAVKIGHIPVIKHLDLQKNNITDISEINEFVFLNLLNLYSNMLLSIPPQIGFLASLKKLYLDKNKLTELPKEIGLLKELVWLSAERNFIEKIPDEIENLSKLQTLCLSDNKIKCLPVALKSLSLTILSISSNSFTSFPSVVTSIKTLRHLTLESNRGIVELPFFNMPNLLEFKVSGTFIIPNPVIEKGSEIILEYLYFASRYDIRINMKGHWISDDQSSFCFSCKKSFSTLKRRHHCRLCGNLFCKKCSDLEIPIPTVRLFGSQRVCKNCFVALEKNAKIPSLKNLSVSDSDSWDEGTPDKRRRTPRKSSMLPDKKWKEYGLSESDQALTLEEKHNKLDAELVEIRLKIEGKVKARNGLTKLVGYYDGDVLQQELAKKQVKKTDDEISFLKIQKKKILNQKIGLDPGTVTEVEIQQQDIQVGVAEEVSFQKAIAICDFVAENEGELEFKVDDVVTIIDKPEGEWYLGELNGQSGYFPYNFVTLITQ